MEDNQNVFDYITTETSNWKTARVPLTRSKDWSMFEHIERCTNVANAWFHRGKNDGLRPYDDIVTPIINVAMRSEGFDVKDIVPFVNDADNYHLSFFVKKYHPQWARKNELDTFIDDVTETSIIYDLVLVKNINNVRPEVVDLKTIAFCDQTNIMAGPICLRHQYTPAEITEFKGKWEGDKIDQAITMAVSEIEVSIAGDQTVKIPGKYIEVFELRGNLPERWLEPNGKSNKYIPQMWLVCYYTDKDGEKQGITLFKGKDKPLSDNFKALKIDRIRSKGRACGRSIVESLFEPQVWNNYSAIKIKDLLDAALTIFQTDDETIANQKLSNLKTNTILHHTNGKPITKVDGTLQNLPAFMNHQVKQENSARIIGSASDAQLGTNPVSGTPFALQNLIVQQGQGLHEYRQGKIATFISDVLYRDWILDYIVKEMNDGKNFSTDLTLEEMQDVAEKIAIKEANRKAVQLVLEDKKITQEIVDIFKTETKLNWSKGGTKRFFKLLKGELADIPVEVFVNIKGKQKAMAQQADKLSNLIVNILKSPQAFSQIPGLGKVFNELLENSGLSPVDFSQITSPQTNLINQSAPAAMPAASNQPKPDMATA